MLNLETTLWKPSIKKEKDALDQVGAKICFVPFIKGFSTTSKIELIQNLKPEPS